MYKHSEESSLIKSARQHKHVSKNPSEKTLVMKKMEEAGIDFSTKELGKLQKNIKQMNEFEVWLQSLDGAQLKEIKTVESLIRMVKSDAYRRVMNKLKKGVDLTDRDIRLLRFFKELLETSHKLKYGEKKVTTNLHLVHKLQDTILSKNV